MNALIKADAYKNVNLLVHDNWVKFEHSMILKY